MNTVQNTIYQAILDEFITGKLKKGDMLPGERLLAEMYQTNTMNAKYAVNCLARRNLVKRVRHAGTFVQTLPAENILSELKNVSGKLSLLLYSANTTGIHWDESTVEKFIFCMKKNKYHVILLPLPGEKAALHDLLLSCASLSPENITILDDNFDHPHLFSLREVFRNFSCPAVRLNRNGAGVPLNTPNTISLDIDHYRNGFLAAQEVLKKNCAVKIVFGITAEPTRNRDSFHALDKEEGLRTAFSEKGCRDVLYYPCEENSCNEIARKIRENRKNVAVITLNSQRAAYLYDFLSLHSLKCPDDYFLLTIEGARQYERYLFSGIIMSREKTGEYLADIACDKALHARADMDIALRMAGHFVKGRTF